VEGDRLGGCIVLVVEDEPLVGLDIAEILTSAGAKVVSASTVAAAIRSAHSHDVSAAILDIRLAGEDSSPVCHHLSARGIPFIFYTGYSSALDGWADVAVLTKPTSPEKIVEAISNLCPSHQQVA
jgi:DNA-binding response OmpR family regulator